MVELEPRHEHRRRAVRVEPELPVDDAHAPRVVQRHERRIVRRLLVVGPVDQLGEEGAVEARRIDDHVGQDGRPAVGPRRRRNLRLLDQREHPLDPRDRQVARRALRRGRDVARALGGDAVVAARSRHAFDRVRLVRRRARFARVARFRRCRRRFPAEPRPEHHDPDRRRSHRERDPGRRPHRSLPL